MMNQMMLMIMIIQKKQNQIPPDQKEVMMKQLQVKYSPSKIHQCKGKYVIDIWEMSSFQIILNWCVLMECHMKLKGLQWKIHHVDA